MSDKMDLAVVQIDRKEFTAMVGKLPFSNRQINLLMKKTPEKFVKERTIRGGGKAKFVQIQYVIGMLNLITGYRWDFEIVNEKEISGQIIVCGKLTVATKDGNTITKTQYGGAEIKKYSKDHEKAGEPMDISSDYKAAASDCIKKCSSLMGIAWDVYGNDEMREVQIIDQQIKKQDVPEVLDTPIEEVRRRVSAALDAMSTPDRLRAIKVTGKLDIKRLTDANWRRLSYDLGIDKKAGGGENEKADVDKSTTT